MPQAVNIPVPVWNVIPIPVAAGGGVNVRAEVEPVEEENHAQFGEPQWMKAFKIESELDLQPDDLVKLLLGVAGGIVPRRDRDRDRVEAHPVEAGRRRRARTKTPT